VTIALMFLNDFLNEMISQISREAVKVDSTFRSMASGVLTKVVFGSQIRLPRVEGFDIFLMKKNNNRYKE
jgi:hypothetical protein